MNDTHPGRAAALFMQLVLGLQQSGMMSLGKLMNPISRKIEIHLEIARDTIDTLAAIEARTKGNLEPDEARVLRQVLTDLRMNYLDAVKKAGTAGAASGIPAGGEVAAATGIPAGGEVAAAPGGSGPGEESGSPGAGASTASD